MTPHHFGEMSFSEFGASGSTHGLLSEIFSPERLFVFVDMAMPHRNNATGVTPRCPHQDHHLPSQETGGDVAVYTPAFPNSQLDSDGSIRRELSKAFRFSKRTITKPPQTHEP